MYIDHSIYKLPEDILYESLYDRLRLRLLKRLRKYSINPVIIVSGFSDSVLLDKDEIVWPWAEMPSKKISEKLSVNWDIGAIRSNTKLTCIFKEEYSKFNYFIQNLKTLGYKNKFNYKVIPYDFRIIGDPEYMSILLDYFTKYVIRLFQNSSKKVTIISYDVGCVLTQIFLNNIDINIKDQFLDKSIMINPTLGGNIYSLKHCFNNMFYCFTGVQLQLPYYKFYGNINQEYLNRVPYKIRCFYDNVILKFQEKSFKDPHIPVVVIKNIYCPDIRAGIIDKIVGNFSNFILIDIKEKNDNNVLLNKKLLNILIKFITK